MIPKIISKGYCGLDENFSEIIWKLYENGTLIFSGKGEMQSYSDSKPPLWSEYAANIKKVIFIGEIENVGDYAFYCCQNLVSVDFSKDIKIIGEAAFCNTSIKELNLPNGVKTLSNLSFSECKFLTEVELPESIGYLGNGVFDGCAALQKIMVFNPKCRFYHSNKVVPYQTIIYGYKDSYSSYYASHFFHSFEEIKEEKKSTFKELIKKVEPFSIPYSILNIKEENFIINGDEYITTTVILSNNSRGYSTYLKGKFSERERVAAAMINALTGGSFDKEYRDFKER